MKKKHHLACFGRLPHKMTGSLSYLTRAKKHKSSLKAELQEVRVVKAASLSHQYEKQQMAGKWERHRGGGRSEPYIRLKGEGKRSTVYGTDECWCANRLWLGALLEHRGADPHLGSLCWLLTVGAWCRLTGLGESGAYGGEWKEEAVRVSEDKEPLMSWPDAHILLQGLKCYVNSVTVSVQEAAFRRVCAAKREYKWRLRSRQEQKNISM